MDRSARYVSAQEASSYLGVSKNTILKYCRTGEIPHRQIGAKVLVLRSWVEADQT